MVLNIQEKYADSEIVYIKTTLIVWNSKLIKNKNKNQLQGKYGFKRKISHYDLPFT